MDLKLKVLVDTLDRLSGPFRAMKSSSDNLGAALKASTSKVRELEKASAQIEAFGRLKRDALANAGALAVAQEKAQKLGQEMAASGTKTKKAQAAFTAARNEVNRLETAQTSIIRETSILRQRMGEAGIDTKQLAASQRQLKRDLDAARVAAMRESTALDTARAKMEAMAKARKQLSAAQEKQGKMAMGGGIAMAGGGAGLMAGGKVMEGAGDFEHSLAAYGLTAGQSGEALTLVRNKIRDLSEQVNVSSLEMLEGNSILVGKGLKPDDALAAMSTIGRAVTGTGAQMADMSALAFSVMGNLKVPQNELTKAFDIMAKAGDEGGFELKDMATYFPLLTASAESLGMSGTKAIGSMSAALQIATKGAADPAEAANNMANFFNALVGKESVKNFEEKGIDIKAALQKGLMEGKDPIETMLKTVGQGIGVDLEKEVSDAMATGLDPKAAAEKVAGRFNLSELFGDAQARNFLTPMLANMKEFRRIRDASMNSDGTVDKKFITMMGTYKKATEGLGNDITNTMEAVGNAMLPVMTPLVNGLRTVVQGVNHFAAANPRLTATLGIAAGALALLVTVGGALTLGMAAMIGPFAMVRFGLTMIGLQGGFAAGALGLLKGGFGLLASTASTVFPMLISGIRAVGMAFMLNPIGLIITGIAAAAALIYVYWEPIKAFFADLWAGVGTSFSGTLNFITTGLQMLLNPLSALASVMGHVFGDDLKGKISGGLQAVANSPPMKIASTAAAAATVAAPLAAAAAPPPPQTIDMGGVSIQVTAAPGQSAEDIAKAVRAELEKMQRQKATDARSRLYDEGQ
ncbi:MAG: phage tail tape measure protein [Rhodospirillaceae bacterium]|nr:phage tail tape measure protein [Rhodospirillales bacterium]